MYVYVYLYIINFLFIYCKYCLYLFIYLVNKPLSVAGISEDNAQSLLGQLFINHRKAFIDAKKHCHWREEVFNNMDEDQERDETFIYE